MVRYLNDLVYCRLHTPRPNNTYSHTDRIVKWTIDTDGIVEAKALSGNCRTAYVDEISVYGWPPRRAQRQNIRTEQSRNETCMHDGTYTVPKNGGGREGEGRGSVCMATDRTMHV